MIIVVILVFIILNISFIIYMRDLVYVGDVPPENTWLIKYLPMYCIGCNQIIPRRYQRTLLGFRFYSGGPTCAKCGA